MDFGVAPKQPAVYLRTTILNSDTSDSKTSYSITSIYTQLYCTICPILEHCGIVDYSIICCGALWSGPDAVLWLNYFQNNTLVQQFLRPLIYFFIDFREDFRQQKNRGNFLWMYMKIWLKYVQSMFCLLFLSQLEYSQGRENSNEILVSNLILQKKIKEKFHHKSFPQPWLIPLKKELNLQIGW